MKPLLMKSLLYEAFMSKQLHAMEPAIPHAFIPLLPAAKQSGIVFFFSQLHKSMTPFLLEGLRDVVFLGPVFLFGHSRLLPFFDSNLHRNISSTDKPCLTAHV